MESGRQDTDPSVRLANEFEILSTQVRLMELCVKQAQATAADAVARVRTQLAALQGELKHPDLGPETHPTFSNQAAQSQESEVQELRAQLSVGQRLLDSRKIELDATIRDANGLRERIADLESMVQKARATTEIEVARTRESLQIELVTLKEDLERKESALQILQASANEVEDELRLQIADLCAQLAAKAELLENRTTELQNVRTELTALRDRLQELELTRAETEAAKNEQHQASIAEIEANLKGQLQDLRNQLTQKQELLDRRDRELETVGSETTLLRERIAELESSAFEAGRSAAAETERVRGELQAELTALQAQLKEKELGLAETQAFGRELEGQLQAQVHESQIKIAEKQLLLETRDVEILGLQNKLSALSEQLVQLESSGQQAATAAASNAELARQGFEVELAARQEELGKLERALADREAQSYQLKQTFTEQLSELQSQLAEKQGLLEARSQKIGEFAAKTNDLQEQVVRLELANKQTAEQAQAAVREIEDSLHARLRELEATISEKAELLQNRTVALENAQSEIGALRDRIQNLELQRAQTEAAKNEADKMREALQSELGNVHRVLEQKDRWLGQREAEFKESSESLNAQFSHLQNQLADKGALLENQSRDLESTRSEITALRHRMHELESAKTASERSVALEIEHFGEQHRVELAGLRADLDRKQHALEEEQAAARALKEKLNGAIYQLETQLAEKQTLLDRGDTELQEKRSEISALREEIVRSEFVRKQDQMLAAVQAEQIREGVRVEIAALDAQLLEKENALKVLADRTQEGEAILNARIADFQVQVAEKQSLTESFRTQLSRLLAQVSHLESTNREAMQQKVATNGLEQSLCVQINELQTQLAEKQVLLENPSKFLFLGEPTLAESKKKIPST